jgi:hypothetical protein
MSRGIRSRGGRNERTSRPCPPRHGHFLLRAAVPIIRPVGGGPLRPDPFRRVFKLRSNLGDSEKLAALVTACHLEPVGISLSLIFFFLLPFSRCRKSPSFMLAVWLRWSPPGRLFSFLLFFHFVFLANWFCLSSERFPRRTCCRAFICYCEAGFVVLPCYPPCSQLTYPSFSFRCPDHDTSY